MKVELQIAVNEVNQAPTLAFIDDASVNEHATLQITAAGSDDDRIDNVPNTLTYSLQGTVPAGAAIDRVRGRLTWTETAEATLDVYRSVVGVPAEPVGVLS